MVDEVKSDVEAYLADMFERNYYPFEFDLVRLTTVEKMIQASFKYERNVRKAATDFMHSIGARRHEKPGGPTARKEHIDFPVWSIRNHDRWTSMGATDRCRALQAYRDQQTKEANEKIVREVKEDEKRETVHSAASEAAREAASKAYQAIMDEFEKSKPPEEV
jgi:hypothetical protein